MKIITNILLLVALVCYTFLPFFVIPLAPKSPTGLDYTAGMISNGVADALYALVPFVACFFAIVCNSAKSRWWGIASCACVVVALFFYYTAAGMHDAELIHDPNIVPSNKLGEGFRIAGVGVGFKVSCGLVVMAFLTSVLSLFPFKINRMIDDSVEHGLEEGRRHISDVGHKVSKEITHLEELQHNRHHAKKADVEAETAAVETDAGQEKDGDAAKPEADYSAYMPHDGNVQSEAAGEEEKYAAYMPKQQDDEA